MENSKLIIYLFSFLIFSATACSVEEESNCQNISGVWEGGYVCTQGATDLTLTIKQNGCDLTAVFNFYESENNPGVPSGSFNMEGRFTQNALFDLEGTEWIDQPDGYEMVDILGSTLNSDENIRVSICGNSTVLTFQ